MSTITTKDGDDGRLPCLVLLRQGVFRDGPHRRSQEVRRADSHHARRRRPDAISRGKDKEALARKLGAHVYIDADRGDPAAYLQSLGGARVILAASPSGKSMTPLFNGLGLRGVMIAIGVSPDPIEVSSVQLIPQTRRLQGWPSGNPVDSEDALNFCALTGVRPIIETFPLDKVSEAFDRMMTSKVRFRAVLMH